MKRLKNILLAMQSQTTTFEGMYEGEMTVVYPSGASSVEYSPVYYSGEIGYYITKTHKLAQDKPTVTILIPRDCLMADLSEALQIHAADFCLREFAKYTDALNDRLYNRSRPDSENGKYELPALGGEILARNAAFFAVCPCRDYQSGPGVTVRLLPADQVPPPKTCLCIRLQVWLPKRNLRKTVGMLCTDLPDAVERFIAEFDSTRLGRALELAQKQISIRAWLKDSDYCAFVANGSILPRQGGSHLSLKDALPFKSTPEDEIEICGVRGMGIPKGVTVITGGGYSGKSTLLDALSAGIYDHVLGDGRELCITDDSAATVSAEDGRSVKHANLSPFFGWIPGKNPADFSTDHASGSVSQAANIVESVESGAKLLLMDEDRSATNFMIRDGMMKELIEKEPITPFTDRVRELYERLGVSTVLVIGGSGEYLSVADRIYKMEDYRIREVTARSKAICAAHGVAAEPPPPADWTQERVLYSEGFSSYPQGGHGERLEVSDTGFVRIGDECVDVRGLHDLASGRQISALGFLLRQLTVSNREPRIDLAQRIDELYERMKTEGVDLLYSSYFTTMERFLDLPRKQELYALIHRMRKIHMEKGGNTQG